MLALWELVAQVEALTLYVAMQAARRGQIAWTPELAQEHNRDWLSQHVPHLLAQLPNAVEEGRCPCGGLALLGHADERGLYHRCIRCGATYLVEWRAYQGQGC